MCLNDDDDDDDDDDACISSLLIHLDKHTIWYVYTMYLMCNMYLAMLGGWGSWSHKEVPFVAWRLGNLFCPTRA